MSTDQETKSEVSTSPTEPSDTNNSVPTSQVQPAEETDQAQTSEEIPEIDVALADQSDSWETDDEGDFYTEPSADRVSEEEDDDQLLSLGLSKHLIECYPMATADELSLVGVVCDICLNEYKTYDKIRTIPCLHRFHTRCIDKWLKKSSKCPMCRSDLRKQKWYSS